MHPLISAWLAYSAEFDRRPHLGDKWDLWLQKMEPLEAWWAELRRLPRGLA